MKLREGVINFTYGNYCYSIWISIILSRMFSITCPCLNTPVNVQLFIVYRACILMKPKGNYSKWQDMNTLPIYSPAEQPKHMFYLVMLVCYSLFCMILYNYFLHIHDLTTWFHDSLLILSKRLLSQLGIEPIMLTLYPKTSTLACWDHPLVTWQYSLLTYPETVTRVNSMSLEEGLSSLVLCHLSRSLIPRFSTKPIW